MTSSLSVSEFLNLFKQEIEGNFANVSIEGEITNWSVSSSGHIYFSLSDQEALINCALFKGDLLRLPGISRKFKNGDNVVCTGPVSVYVKRGSFQLIVKSIKAAGLGDLMVKFNELKAKLDSEGLFDQHRKKSLPNLPINVGIITAETGAALQDFINVFSRRSFQMNLMIFPCLVQGATAPEEIIKSIDEAEKFHQSQGLDVLVLARGGGSLEDLWAFNDEKLARRIANCKIPTVSAIGHQIDFTISDFVADLRAETPTAAAEILSQYQMDYISTLYDSYKMLQMSADRVIQQYGRKLDGFRPEFLLGRILDGIKKVQLKLSAMGSFRHPETVLRIYEKIAQLDEAFNRISNALDRSLVNSANKISNLEGLLKATNPRNVLGRGYAIMDSGDGIISGLQKFENLAKDTKLKIVFHDGEGHVRKV
jgi:exodeoxyribonuclease VII large subunit